jgi:menaquinone-dependent protoporphyrinogen IX oxidase
MIAIDIDSDPLTYEKRHENFDKVVIANGFKIHNFDKCIYSKFHKINESLYVYKFKTC